MSIVGCVLPGDRYQETGDRRSYRRFALRVGNLDCFVASLLVMTNPSRAALATTRLLVKSGRGAAIQFAFIW